MDLNEFIGCLYTFKLITALVIRCASITVFLDDPRKWILIKIHQFSNENHKK